MGCLSWPWECGCSPSAIAGVIEQSPRSYLKFITKFAQRPGLPQAASSQWLSVARIVYLFLLDMGSSVGWLWLEDSDGFAKPTLGSMAVYDASTQSFLLSLQSQTCFVAWWLSQSYLSRFQFSLLHAPSIMTSLPYTSLKKQTKQCLHHDI